MAGRCSRTTAMAWCASGMWRRARSVPPESAPARLNLAVALLARQSPEAQEHLAAAMELLAVNPSTLNHAAWRLATLPGASAWPGRAGLPLAKKAVERKPANR